ncbi:uncharacterized protein LOC125502028 isoform X2 [Athalia rosae]|uniref:uncharacterized protein LOC125502028 isoform X2 n=1 Tax=Athalia rosae TaxID=37344 RepID=UPI0020337C66|nr:uncharacterized protein LOC125502028 isoform X2 [Athalia rosae]
MWYVVICNDWCATVPRGRIDLGSLSFSWPPSTSKTAALVKRKDKADYSWPILEYRKIYGPYSTYEEARRIERESVCISTSDEAQFASLSNQTLPKKRKIIKRNFCDNQSDIQQQVATATKMRSIPAPPSSYKKGLWDSSPKKPQGTTCKSPSLLQFRGPPVSHKTMTIDNGSDTDATYFSEALDTHTATEELPPNTPCRYNPCLDIAFDHGTNLFDSVFSQEIGLSLYSHHTNPIQFIFK